MLRQSLRSLLLLASAPVFVLACSGDPEEPPAEPSPTAALIIDRASVDYGELEVGQSSAEHLFTVRNASPVAVEAVKVLVDRPAFVITANTCERFLDAGRECQVRVKFAPTLAGTYEARLRMEGAPEVDHAVLSGTAFAYVDVRAVPPSTQVVVGQDEASCGSPCRVPVRSAEVTLRVAPAGFPRWGGACATATRACKLRMDGTKVVSLEELSPAVKWEQRWDRHPRTVAVAPDGDIVVQDGGYVTRLSSTGQTRWRLEALGPTGMALDRDGNAHVLSYSGRVTRLAPDGRELWSFLPQDTEIWGQRIAVAPDGSAYFVVGMGMSPTARQFKLYALTSQGTERWSRTFDEGSINYLVGLGVDAQGAVYLSGDVYRSDGTPTGLISEKRYFRKLRHDGTQVWETQESWYNFAVSSTGMTSAILSTGGAVPGAFHQWMIDSNGRTLWNTPTLVGPGVVDTQGFSAGDTLLVGGHQESSATSTVPGRGWFAAMNLDARLPGPVTYVDAPANVGARVASLALTPNGGVVVGLGFGAEAQGREGSVRVYDARVLTVDLNAP
jgi:hypothetical protein